MRFCGQGARLAFLSRLQALDLKAYFIGLKDLKPPALDLRQLYQKETSSTEPILIIISPGADPSQELEDLAKAVLGLDKYFQVRA